MGRSPHISGMEEHSDLLGLSRLRARATEQKTIAKRDLPLYESKGWSVLRINKASFRLSRPKLKPSHLEHRVWSVLYKMGFSYLSGEKGVQLVFDDRDPKSPSQQIAVVAVDDEVAIAFECKSYEIPRTDPRFTAKLAKHSKIRGPFARAVRSCLPCPSSRKVATPVVTWDLDLRETDVKRASQEKVTVFSERELAYYEALVRQLGPAARYQLLADLFPDKRIDGLTTRLPALRTKMGPYIAYTFAVRPEYLLKTCYIAHRAKGEPGDLDAYQRMVKKSRLADIGSFISQGGIFPTNIVINFDRNARLRFDRGKQEAQGADAGATFGWLTIEPSYGSAWIIDGQHRLFAYSGHPRAASSFLSVVAFDGLDAAKQTELFVDVNSEQRRVPRSLLVQLDAVLKWNSRDENKRINAIVSRACMGLDQHEQSPLRDRVLLSDMRRTNQRCVSLTALASALSKPGFYVLRKRRGFREYGYLWRDDPTQALTRTIIVISSWLGTIAEEAKEWWDLGADEGGGLAMNDGVTVCMRMLRSVLEHLGTPASVGALDAEEVVGRCRPYAQAVGAYFARMTPEERGHFRSLRGGQGQDTGTRECQVALNEEFPAYNPEGLQEWKNRVKANTNEQARSIIDAMEKNIQDRVLLVLREEFDLNADAWWFEGVPKNVRKKVSARIEEAGGGQREHNFDLLHYEAIIKANWLLFRPLFAYGKGGNVGKEKGTAWLREVAQWRNKVMHPSRRDYLSLEELSRLEGYQRWLTEKLEKTME